MAIYSTFVTHLLFEAHELVLLPRLVIAAVETDAIRLHHLPTSRPNTHVEAEHDDVCVTFPFTEGNLVEQELPVLFLH